MTNRQARVHARIVRMTREEAEKYLSYDHTKVMTELGKKTSQVHDVFGSNARRAMQAEKDAKEIAEPVAATPAGTGRLNLRPIAERVARRAGEDR